MNKILLNLTNKKSVQRYIKWASKEVNGESNFRRIVQRTVPSVTGVWISGFYIMNTVNSKKIEEKRKPALILNIAINTLIGVIGGHFLSDAIYKLKDKAVKKFEEVVTDISPEKKKILIKGLGSSVPLFAFTVMFRVIGPIIATPLAEVGNKFLIKHGIWEDPEKNKKSLNIK